MATPSNCQCNPEKIQPGINEEIGSQLDVFPTIMSFLNMDYTHASFGKSLFDEGKRAPLVNGMIPGITYHYT